MDNNDEVLKKQLLSMKAAAIAMKSGCHDDEIAIIANMNGRIWAINAILGFMKDNAIRTERGSGG